MFRTEFKVVKDSIRVNRGLKNSELSMASRGGVTDRSGLDVVKSAFANQSKPSRPRTELQGVQDRLDRDLALSE